MEKQLVRESKVRHVFGKTWRKEVSITNLRLKSSGAFIEGNDRFLVFPWDTVGGALCVLPTSYTGKVSDSTFLLRAHQQDMLCAAFSPFDPALLATGSRESAIKMWRLEEEVLSADMTEPTGTLEGHKSRIQKLAFHPHASNLLLTVSGDKTQKLWDVAAESELLSMAAPSSEVQSAVWAPDGKLFATTCRDRQLRLFDPRQGVEPTQAVVAHQGLKGLQATFLGGTDRLVTVGFSKDSRYQLALWDMRMIKEGEDWAAMKLITNEPNPALLTPHYDPGTGLLFLSGRGDKIHVYEVDNTAPYFHPITRVKTPSYNSSYLVPKRAYDVKKCEVGRFYLLANKSVEIQSISVPRKTSATVFQEDLYPPVTSGDAGTTAPQWMEGDDTPAPTTSLQPEGMASVFDLSEAEGGKDKGAEMRKRLERSGSSVAVAAAPAEVELPRPEMSSGLVNHHLGGWSAPWAERWMVLEEDEGLQFFKSEDSAKMLFTIPFETVTKCEQDEGQQDQFLIHGKKLYRMKAEDAATAARWAEAISVATSNWSHPQRVEARAAEAAAPASSSAPGSPVPARAAGKEGFLEALVPGSIYTGTASWTRRWYVLEGKVLFAYSGNRRLNQHPLEKMSLTKVVAVIKSAAMGDKKHSLKILTPGQVLYLAAENAEEQDAWVTAILLASPLGKAMAAGDADDVSSYVMSAATEGYLMRRVGSTWEKVWLSSIGKTLLYFKNETSAKPLAKYSIKDVKEVEVPDDQDQDFFLKLNTGESVLHRASSEAERNKWTEKLQALLKRHVDVFDVMRIRESEVESSEYQKAIEANAIDPVEVKNGRCPLLIQIKGRKRIRVALVDRCTASLTTRSSFVLDNGRVLYQWNGSKAPRVTKAKAGDLANKIRMKERGGLADVIVLDQGKNDENATFWKLLKGERAAIRDDVPEEEGQLSVRIYRCLAKSVPKPRRIQLIHDSTQLPPREFLDPTSCSVVDCDTEIFVWVGHKSKLYNRKLAMLVAKKLTQEQHRQAWTSITRIVENGETILFKEKFSNYPGMLPINVSRAVVQGRVAQAQVQEPIDVKRMHSVKEREPIGYGEGAVVNVWRIDGFDKRPVPEERWGTFYSADSYVVLFRYRVPQTGKDLNLVYYWQGADSTMSEKGTSAYMTVDVSSELAGGDAEQQRVPQDKEPQHFLEIFGGSVRVCKGKETAADAQRTALYRVSGADGLVRATEQPASAALLNALHSFVLATKAAVFVWKGPHSSAAEKALAAKTAAEVAAGRKVAEAAPGSEPSDFWSALGGKAEYFGSGGISARKPTKLFLVSNATGSIKATAVHRFAQEDLETGHCAILDAFFEVFVWFGAKASDSEKQMAMEAAVEYVQQSPAGHAASTPVFVTEQYREPAGFIAQFHSWSKARYPAAKKKESPSKAPVDEVLQRFTTVTYSLAELQKDPLPDGIDPTRLEQYLTNEEFEKVFGMSRKDFMMEPMWKAEKIKQEVGLY